MHALIIMAHGSRREASNLEIARLTERLRDRLSDYDDILHAFLELAEPNLASAVDKALERGATALTIFPYFLVAGRHVAEDIPAEVEALRAAKPDLSIRLMEYFGNDSAIDEVVATRIEESGETITA